MYRLLLLEAILLACEIAREARDRGASHARGLLGDLERGSGGLLTRAILRLLVGSFRHLASQFGR